MGTTPIYGLPYPEGSGLVIQGDDDMQALAEAVEAELAEIRTRSFISMDAGPAQTFGVGGGVLEFSGGSMSTDWTHDGAGTFTFSGPNTWFIASLRVNMGPNTAAMRSTVVLSIAGAAVQISDMAAAAAGGTDYARHTHGITLPFRIEAPQQVQVQVSATGTAVPVSSRSLRLVSLPD